MEEYMICEECDSKMTSEVINQSFRFNGKKIILKGFNAYKCPNCGNVVYSAEEAEMIDKLVRAF